MSSLALVSWTTAGYRFALEARQVQVLLPWSDTLDSLGLHAFIDGLETEMPAYCLGWQDDGQTRLLAVRDEPRHIELPLETLWPLPAVLQQARRNPAIRALGWFRQSPLIILDTRGLSAEPQPAAHSLSADRTHQ